MIVLLARLPDQCDIQHIRVPMDVCAEAIVATQRMGHFEEEALGDADVLAWAHLSGSKCAVK
jgi:hypothetical protein